VHFRICLVVAEPYTSASIHASSIPEFSVDDPRALSAHDYV